MTIKTRFRGWALNATPHTCTGKKDNYTFKITHLPDFPAALRAGKREIDEREGVEQWIEGYTNELLGDKNEHL
jgi:hypothetical protein